MKKFVVYEIWTRHRIVEAESMEAALEDDVVTAPIDWSGMSLCNWHAVECPGEAPKTEAQILAEQRAARFGWNA